MNIILRSVGKYFLKFSSQNLNRSTNVVLAANVERMTRWGFKSNNLSNYNKYGKKYET
jgi:hypothetical protein